MAFIDRIVEYPNRYLLEDTGGTQTGPYTLIRDEGTIYDEGTPLNAANLNGEISNALSNFDIDNSGNVHVRNVQCGLASEAVGANATISMNITFSPAFTGVPYVNVTPLTSSPTAWTVSVASITTTGCTIWLKNNNASSYTAKVNWIAML